MKQSLQLKLGQSLTMTPQLQQAIKLLQLSALDLQQEIQQTIEINPLLELDEGEFDDGELDSLDADESPDQDLAGENTDVDDFDFGEGTGSLTELDGREDSVPDEMPVDTEWEDVYADQVSDHSSELGAAEATLGTGSGEDWDFTETNSAAETLLDSLSWQLNLLPLSATDRIIAETLVEAINDDGMLSLGIDEITASINRNMGLPTTQTTAEVEAESDIITEAEVMVVLKLIQRFEPAGIAARDLRECLLIQLQQLPDDIEHKVKALLIVSEHLDILAARDFTHLKRATKFSQEELSECIALIQSLNPRPGSAISAERTEYVVPEVFVRKHKENWVVELNAEAMPKVRINELYAKLIKRADNSADNTYLKDNLQEARWFLKSLQSRSDTLLKVAIKIVEHQRGFFEYGPEAMKPLVLNEIAEAVEMHESTISRVTSRKYMHTPRGIFELKYFFSSHVGTTTGGEVSSTAIRALIKKMTAEENTQKPLSDNKITALLKEQNIKVARRTVAKYRESLGIPPSNERKRIV